MTNGPATHTIKAIWKRYALDILAANPLWVGVKRGTGHNRIDNYTILRKEYDDEKKLIKVTEIFTYKLFKEVVEAFYKKAKEAIIGGECLNITNGLGKIFIKRIDRFHGNKVIDYYKTLQQPKVWCDKRKKFVRERIVYFTSDDYCKICWKKSGRVRHETLYKFTPSGKSHTGVGFGEQLSRALNANPLLKYKYIHCPIRSYAI